MLAQRVLSQTSHVKQVKIFPASSRLQSIRWTAEIAVNKEKLLNSSALANAKPFEDIPSFFMLPFIGTAWIYFPIIGLYNVQQQHKAVADKRRRFGDVYREKFGSINVAVSFNPDDVQVILENEGPYPFRAKMETMKAYRESRKKWYSTNGLMILQGKEWHNLRTKTQKHLLKPKAIQAYLNPMQDVAKDFVNKISFIRDRNNEVPDFLGELYKWALESVALVGLDTRLGCLDKNLSDESDGMKMINSVQTQFQCMNKLEGISGRIPFWKFLPSPTWKKLVKAGDSFTEIAFKYINRSLEELKRNSETEDKEMTLLQSMLMEKGLDISGAMVTVADMLMAGIDTTSHSVGFFLYNIAKNPEKQELLYKELKKLLPNKEDRITPNIFNELKYLKACIKESQRLYPIAGGVVRSLDHDVVFSGYRVPAGTILIVSMRGICTDEKYYSNPNKYLPERWLNKDEKFHSFAYVPFGVGVRSCIGRRLAELEIISLTTELIRNFKVTYQHEDIGIVTRLISSPDKPLRFNFIER